MGRTEDVKTSPMKPSRKLTLDQGAATVMENTIQMGPRCFHGTKALYRKSRNNRSGKVGAAILEREVAKDEAPAMLSKYSKVAIVYRNNVTRINTSISSAV